MAALDYIILEHIKAHPSPMDDVAAQLSILEASLSQLPNIHRADARTACRNLRARIVAVADGRDTMARLMDDIAGG